MNRHFWQRGVTWGLAIVVLTSGGCSFFPEALQPHNLQKWNRGPGPSGDPFLSVPDPMPSPPPHTDAAAETEDELSTIQAG